MRMNISLLILSLALVPQSYAGDKGGTNNEIGKLACSNTNQSTYVTTLKDLAAEQPTNLLLREYIAKVASSKNLNLTSDQIVSDLSVSNLNDAQISMVLERLSDSDNEN